MALRHPWFSQSLKRKCSDDLLLPEGSNEFGVVGTVYGSLTTNAYNNQQAPQPNQTLSLNGRATKRVRKSRSRNLERGFAELSIQPTPPTSSSPAHIIQQQHTQQRSDTQVGGDGVWNNVVGDVGESSTVVCPNGLTLPLLRSSSVDEPPSPEVADIQMSTSTWYEPEKDRIIITSLDDDEYDGDDEGQQQRTGTKPTPRESDFTISPAFLNAINKKLAQAVDPPAPPLTDTPTSQALILFRPLPSIAHSSANDGLKDVPNGHEEGMLDNLIQKPSSSSPFYAQDVGQSSFVPNDDDMEIEML